MIGKRQCDRRIYRPARKEGRYFLLSCRKRAIGVEWGSPEMWYRLVHNQLVWSATVFPFLFCSIPYARKLKAKY